jgi:ferrous-iron efflux pump FieF
MVSNDNRLVAETKTNKLDTARKILLVKMASYASVTVALTLVALKSWGWLATDSVSLLSSLADSVLDVLASGVTFWAIRYSLSPADEEHRFGHGKSEGIAALVQALIVAGSGVYVCTEAMQRLLLPQPITAPEIGLSVIFIATAATVFLVGFQRYVGRLTGSLAISADAVHYQSDLLVNLGVGLSLILTPWTGWDRLDAVVGLIVALFILRSALEIGSRSLEILLDHEIPLEDRDNIKTIALNHPDVRGFHDMKTRFGGKHYIVQFHLEMDQEISLLRTHQILDVVEDNIRDRYPGCEIIIHADPLGLPERRDPFGHL